MLPIITFNPFSCTEEDGSGTTSKYDTTVSEITEPTKEGYAVITACMRCFEVQSPLIIICEEFHFIGRINSLAPFVYGYEFSPI